MAADIIAFESFSLPVNGEILCKKTGIGTFRGVYEEGSVDELSFNFELPKIPMYLLSTIVKEFKRNSKMEAIMQIFYSKRDGYYLQMPEVESVSNVHVGYRFLKNADTLVMTVHSHNRMAAFFSQTDNEDETYPGLFGVIGRVDKNPQIKIRAGYNGSFVNLNLDDIFENGGNDIA